MSTRKPTPDNILDDVLGAAEIDETSSAIPVFQPTPPPPHQERPPRRKAQTAPATDTATPPAPIVFKPVEWEHREVIFRDYRGWRVRYIDGRELRDWKNGPTLLEYLAQAGREGWELVSMSNPHHNQKTAYLKRAK